MPKVSIVIPLYNKVPHIARAINSALGQTVQDFEIIVVNDGSTDGSAEVVAKMVDCRIRVVHQRNQGVSVARNRGIDEASADLVAFLDADDSWKPWFLETVLSLKDKFSHAGLFAVAYEIHKRKGRITRPNLRAIPPSFKEGIIPNYFDSVLGDFPFLCSGVAIPKRIFGEVGKFPEGEKMGEDLDMWLRIAMRYPMVFSNRVGVTYFVDAINRACDKKQALGEYRLLSTIDTAIRQGKVIGKDRVFLEEYKNKSILEAARGSLLAGERFKCRGLLRRCDTNLFRRRKLFIFLASLLPYRFIAFSLGVKRKFF